jgi:hypothetical protein
VRRADTAKRAASREAERQKLESAVAMLPEAAKLALETDAAMKVLHEATTAFEDNWARIKALSGAGPQKMAIGVHLGRSFRVGLRGLPGIVADMVPTNERHSVTELNTGWSRRVSNMAATAKSKPKNTEAAIAA